MATKTRTAKADEPDFSQEAMERLYDEIMEKDRSDKRHFLTIAFDFQSKHLWESRSKKSLGRFVGADWNAPKYRMTDVMN